MEEEEKKAWTNCDYDAENCFHSHHRYHCGVVNGKCKKNEALFKLAISECRLPAIVVIVLVVRLG